jgi:hypothetical protein
VSNICTACGTVYEPKPPKWLHCDLDQAPIRPNWGHGPNQPVPMYTEAEIRTVMKRHRPGNEGDCVCAWGVGADHTQEFTVDHLLDKLKEHRHGQEAHLHPDVTQR